jgi:hypothetical protein
MGTTLAAAGILVTAGNVLALCAHSVRGLKSPRKVLCREARRL